MYIVLQIGVLPGSGKLLKQCFHRSRGADIILPAGGQHNGLPEPVRVRECVDVTKAVPELCGRNFTIRLLQNAVSISGETG